MALLIFVAITFGVALSIAFASHYFGTGGLDLVTFIGRVVITWVILVVVGLVLLFGWLIYAFRWG